MMESLNALISKLRGIDATINAAIKSTIARNEHVILDMNTNDQLYEKGINSKGVSINSYAPYTPFTVSAKRLKRQPTNRVTLSDEGDFHESFFIEYQSNGFEIKASNWKTEKLKDKYGDTILGLTLENINELRVNYIAPEIAKIFKKL